MNLDRLKIIPSVNWLLPGGLLLIAHFGLVFLSSRFETDIAVASRPILLLVAILLLVGLVYLYSCQRLRAIPYQTSYLVWILLVGAVLRLAFLNTPPIQEDDYYRYLWDGGVVANGVSPFRYTPERILDKGIQDDDDRDLAILRELAQNSNGVLSKVNHPHLRSIYPPMAQAVFGLSYLIGPWSLVTWRCVLFFFDGISLYLLIQILQALDFPVTRILFYWWNPLIPMEIYNSAHMDILVLPFMLGAVLLAIRRHHHLAAVSLGLAAGVKLWPVVLLPVILQSLAERSKQVLASGVFCVICICVFYPVYHEGLDRSSGFTVFAQSWEINDALFMLVLWGSEFLLSFLDLNSVDSQILSRAIVGVLFSAWLGWVLFKKQALDVTEKCLLVLAALFLLSPAQFPWYYIWILPFLAIHPNWPLLLMSALLPLYYLRFHFEARDNVVLFDYGIVWLEYIPVWGLLLLDRYRTGRRGADG